jgi:CheY-like chemotaxis protein
VARALPAKAILLVEDKAADASLIQRAAHAWGRNLHLWTMADGPEALMSLRKEPHL